MLLHSPEPVEPFVAAASALCAEALGPAHEGLRAALVALRHAPTAPGHALAGALTDEGAGAVGLAPGVAPPVDDGAEAPEAARSGGSAVGVSGGRALPVEEAAGAPGLAEIGLGAVGVATHLATVPVTRAVLVEGAMGLALAHIVSGTVRVAADAALPPDMAEDRCAAPPLLTPGAGLAAGVVPGPARGRPTLAPLLVVYLAGLEPAAPSVVPARRGASAVHVAYEDAAPPGGGFAEPLIAERILTLAVGIGGLGLHGQAATDGVVGALIRDSREAFPATPLILLADLALASLGLDDSVPAARRELARLSASRPDITPVRWEYALARAYQAAGDEAQARAAYQRALERVDGELAPAEHDHARNFVRPAAHR